MGHSAILRSVRLSVPGLSCLRCAAALGYRHAGSNSLTNTGPASRDVCGLRTRPRTDVDPPRVELPSGGKGQIVSRPRGDNLLQSERDDDVIIGLHSNDDDVYNSRAYLVRDKLLMIDMSLNVKAAFSALLGRPIE